MDPSRWEEAVRLFEEAREIDPGQRARFLEEACAGDRALLAEVRALLLQPVSEAGPLEDLAAETSRLNPARLLPETVGPYRILGLLGEGGMGVVYRAQQDHPKRIVALKVIQPGLTTPEALRRFQSEAEALGRLQHPGIAQIFDAGTAGGQHYFAMEFVAGESLRDYLAGAQLTLAARVELAARICDAVQHAHERGIVHRDLKPGNVLVDGSGQPKVIDFGVARLLAAASPATRTGALIGTIAYMSPEQVSGQVAGERSDVYSLGLILYFALSGRMPYPVDLDTPAVLRHICETEPVPLGSGNRQLGGDLEAIAAKALEKDASRRYSSAGALADDLRRHLGHQPVLAKPPNALYHARKFALRHRGFTASLVGLFLTLTAGIVITVWQNARARAAERTAAAVIDFLERDLLAQASPAAQAGPGSAPNPGLTVREVLDRASRRLAGNFAAQPQVEAAIRHTIGVAYQDLGDSREAGLHLKRSWELRRALLGPEDSLTLDTAQELGKLYALSGNLAEAGDILTGLAEARRRRNGAQHPATLAAVAELASVMSRRGDHAKSARLNEQILEDLRRSRGPEHPDTLV